jgi:hypothetical protein
VFKLISERARLDTGDAVTKRLDRSRSIYKIALGQRGNQEDRIREGLDQQLIHLGWGGDIDWSDDCFDDFEEIRKKWNAEKDPDASGKDPNIEMTFAFRSGLQVGDYVVISDGETVSGHSGRSRVSTSSMPTRASTLTGARSSGSGETTMEQNERPSIPIISGGSPHIGWTRISWTGMRSKPS